MQSWYYWLLCYEQHFLDTKLKLCNTVAHHCQYLPGSDLSTICAGGPAVQPVLCGRGLLAATVASLWPLCTTLKYKVKHHTPHVYILLIYLDLVSSKLYHLTATCVSNLNV